MRRTASCSSSPRRSASTTALAALRIGRKQRRLELDLVEGARDDPRALDGPAADPHGWNGHHLEPAWRHRERMRADHQVLARVIDPFVFEHQPRRQRRG
ncbi:MAG TPA: hypothetical protein VNT54_06415 [Solirubrobacteraceae bacterium]|nr:hypothetical protein [Solirubrobacteraceae bacterium]